MNAVVTFNGIQIDRGGNSNLHTAHGSKRTVGLIWEECLNLLFPLWDTPFPYQRPVATN